jgi:uncharacterized protein YbjT (DUF2867 family)
MADKKIIAVVGATGAQGGGLVRAILGDPGGEFAARAITRDVNSPGAQELAKRGAEVVAADIDDFDSVRRAFDGAYGAFCVTFFWHHFSADKEKAEAHIMAEAARDAGLQHVIWSTFEDTRNFVPLDDDRMPTLQGKYKVPHFDGKGESDQVFRDLGVPTTFLLTSFYWDNFIHFGLEPKRNEEGKLMLVVPMGDEKLPSIAAADIGGCALGIFKRGAEYIGKYVGIAGEHLSFHEFAAAMSEALGEEVIYQPVEPDVFRGFGFPGADDVGNMFQFNRDFAGPFGEARKIEVARELNPRLQTFRDWLAENKNRIPIDPRS